MISKQTLLLVFLTGFVLSPVLVFARTDGFTRTLYVGMRGEDVRELQTFLNTDTETRVADAGTGSPGNETDYFGPGTKRALIKFQEKWRKEVLTSIGLSAGTGILGSKTREKLNMLLKVESPVVTSKSSNLSVSTASKPTRLKIPIINVDSSIEYVGLTPLGAMDAPKGPINTAWFNLGPRPGDIGSAVIAGHYGPWKNGGGSVFDNLNKLQKGDKIYVSDEKGAITTFVVRESETFGESQDAPKVFSSSDGEAHLNLVTCGGIWDKVSKSYSNRLVVFTDKVGPTDSPQ